MRDVLNAFQTHANLGSDSIFLDIGSGLGRPLLHAIFACGVAATIGVESDAVKCQKAVPFVKYCMEHMSASLAASTKAHAAVELSHTAVQAPMEPDDGPCSSEKGSTGTTGAQCTAHGAVVPCADVEVGISTAVQPDSLAVPGQLPQEDGITLSIQPDSSTVPGQLPQEDGITWSIHSDSSAVPGQLPQEDGITWSIQPDSSALPGQLPQEDGITWSIQPDSSAVPGQLPQEDGLTLSIQPDSSAVPGQQHPLEDGITLSIQAVSCTVPGQLSKDAVISTAVQPLSAPGQVIMQEDTVSFSTQLVSSTLPPQPPLLAVAGQSLPPVTSSDLPAQQFPKPMPAQLPPLNCLPEFICAGMEYLPSLNPATHLPAQQLPRPLPAQLPPLSCLPKFICAGVEDLPSLDPATHAYAAWEGFPDGAKAAVGRLFASSSTLTSIAIVQRSFRQLDPELELEHNFEFGPVNLVARVDCYLTGSRRHLNAYVFVKTPGTPSPSPAPPSHSLFCHPTFDPTKVIDVLSLQCASSHSPAPSRAEGSWRDSISDLSGRTAVHAGALPGEEKGGVVNYRGSGGSMMVDREGGKGHERYGLRRKRKLDREGGNGHERYGLRRTRKLDMENGKGHERYGLRRKRKLSMSTSLDKPTAVPVAFTVRHLLWTPAGDIPTAVPGAFTVRHLLETPASVSMVHFYA
eukprot:gene26845-4449_t